MSLHFDFPTVFFPGASGNAKLWLPVMNSLGYNPAAILVELDYLELPLIRRLLQFLILSRFRWVVHQGCLRRFSVQSGLTRYPCQRSLSPGTVIPFHLLALGSSWLRAYFMRNLKSWLAEPMIWLKTIQRL